MGSYAPLPGNSCGCPGNPGSHCKRYRWWAWAFPLQLDLQCFLAITVCGVDTPPRLQRPIAESRHDCSDSSHLSGINDVTPSDFDTETQCSTYLGDFHSWQILCQQICGVLLSWDFGHVNFAFSHQVLPRPVLWQIPLHALLSVKTLSDTAPLVQIPKSAQPAKKPRPRLLP